MSNKQKTICNIYFGFILHVLLATCSLGIVLLCLKLTKYVYNIAF